MSRKIYALMFVGVILGTVVGFGISLVYVPEFLDDILPFNYKTRLNEVSEEYLNMSEKYDAVVTDLDKLRGELDDLRGDYDILSLYYKDLEGEYSFLSEEFTNLTRDYYILMETHNETLEEYDSLLMQYQIITGSSPLSPQTQSNDTLRKDFAWIYDGKTWAFSLNIPEHLHIYYSNKTRVPTEDYSVYVTHPYDDEYIFTMIRNFDEIAQEEGYDDSQKVNLVVSFIQSLPYTTDNVTTDFDEYPRYPIETLVHGGGDCEDTSILASALLNSMGFDVVLINFPEHVAVGVALDTYGTYWIYEGTQYFYVETTGEGWEIGQIPEAHQGESAYIYPLISTPICTHTWTASKLRHKVTIVADIQNVGTAEATGIKLYVAFEGQGDVHWNPMESALFDLDVGEETTIMLELNEPRDVHTRLVIYILDAFGRVMDESHSTWFDTN